MDRIEIIKIIEKRIVDTKFYDARLLIDQYKKTFGLDDNILSAEAVLEIYSGNVDSSLQIIRKGLEINIFNCDLYFTLGNVYEIQKNYNKAYLCYMQALNLCKSMETMEVIKNNISKIKNENDIKVNKVSYVILTYNQLEYTKLCIDSIRKYDIPNSYEIIIVDNHSTDGTVEWLKKQKDIKVKFNDENKGFPAGCNQGIKISNEDNDIFLLNNDTVMMPNSIFNLRMALYSEENIGAVGAISNNVSYYQKIDCNFNSLDEYVKFSIKNNITNEELYEKRLKLVGFAMLIKRHVLNEVGYLDERFSPGNFEDDDLSFRIICKGYKLILAKDSYIHHFGSVSFKTLSNGFSELLQKNSKKFKEKWGFSSEYSTGIRSDIICNIDNKKDENLKVLEIGCACGATLLKIKDLYPNAEVFGIELDENSAKIAKTFADVRVVNIEDADLGYKEGFFDYIIFADVLEHLYNPLRSLKKIKKYLKKDGYIIASIPNVLNYTVILDLLRGNWTYSDAGILDRTHLRFFTLKEVVKLFGEAEYINENILYTKVEIDEESNKLITRLSNIHGFAKKEEFEAYQYIVKAKRKL